MFVLLLCFLAATAVQSASECRLTGTFIDSAHVGSGSPSKVQVLGNIFIFSGFKNTAVFANNVSEVVVSRASEEWFDVEYQYGGCGLARVDGAVMELTAPLSSCATSWPTKDAEFKGEAVRGTQPFCNLWILGVIGALAGTFLSTLGLGFQKLTHERLKAEGKEIENYCHHPIWVLGISCLVIDAILDLWTFGLAPASLLAPLSSMGIVWNTVTSPCLLGEKITTRGMVGSLVIMAGSVCATIFSQHETPGYTLDDFGKRWSSAEVILYEVSCICVYVGSKYYLHRMAVNYNAREHDVGGSNVSTIEKSPVDDSASGSQKEDGTSARSIKLSFKESFSVPEIPPYSQQRSVSPIPISFSTDLESVAAAASRKPSEVDPEKETMMLNYAEGSRERKVAQFLMALVAGMLGGQSIIFAKTLVELLKATYFPPIGAAVFNAFTAWQFYLFLVALISILMTETKLLNVAMHNFDSLEVIPIFLNFYVIFGTRLFFPFSFFLFPFSFLFSLFRKIIVC
jgi:hypothetical protein